MKKNRLPEISVGEVMRKIEEELAKRRTVPHDGTLRSGVNALLPDLEEGVRNGDPLSTKTPERGLIGGTLWKYGTRYATLIKKVPGLSRIAEYFYWRLSSSPIPPAHIAAAPSSGSDILTTNLNYAGFIEGLKHEGLKGKIKRRIFTVIGFFGWWQGQVNAALYEKLASQGAQLAKQEAQLTSQEAQLTSQEAQLTKQEAQLTSQEAQLTKQEAQLISQEAQLISQEAELAKQEAQLIELAARLAEQVAWSADKDKIIEGLVSGSLASERTIKEFDHKLSVLSRLEDAVYEELITQRAEMARQRGWPVRNADSQGDRG